NESVSFVWALFELIPIKRTPLSLNLSAVSRVTSFDPTTYGQWLHVKKMTKTSSLKSFKSYVFPSVPFKLNIGRSEEHTSELQSRFALVCRRLLVNISEYDGVVCTRREHTSV